MDAHAETSTGVVDWTKASQDYFPILADEAVQQKGKHRQRTMIIQRGAPLATLLRVRDSFSSLCSSEERRSWRRCGRRSSRLCVRRRRSRLPQDVRVHVLDLGVRSSRHPLLLDPWLTWLPSDDAFRSVTQNAPPAKRAYLDAIRHTIQKQLNGRPPGTRFWLFSLRDDRSSLQTFEPL